MLKGEILEKKRAAVHLLGECVMTCNYCHNACLEEDNVKMMADCIRMDKECAEVCQFTIGMLHKSKFVDKYLDLCIQVCEACAAECGKHHYDHCKLCAEVCTECAKACRDFMAAIRNK